MAIKLTLIRGLPGSGKSTRAKAMVSQYRGSILHLEADMYFVDKQGIYRFDESKLSNAHQWCRAKTEQGLVEGSSVIVSNTFVQRWEIEPYYYLAKKLKVEFEVLVCTGEFGSIHNVPEETIEKMKKRWQTWRSDLQL